MSIKSKLNYISDKVEIGSNAILFVSMSAMGIILGASIVMRFIFHQPIRWANEISRYLYIYVVLLGTAVSYKGRSHAKIDFVRNAAPPKMKIIFDVLHYAVMMFVSILLLIMGIKHVITMWPVHAPVLTFLPVGIVYLSVPISAFALLLFTVNFMFEIEGKENIT